MQVQLQVNMNAELKTVQSIGLYLPLHSGLAGLEKMSSTVDLVNFTVHYNIYSLRPSKPSK